MWTGALAPRRALQLIGGLFDIPRSRFSDLVRGDNSFGWDRNSPILADIADIITALVRGLAGQKLTDRERQPRPAAPMAEKTEAPPTISDFDVAWFMHQL